jgi:ABC-2 type transport system permease protein
MGFFFSQFFAHRESAMQILLYLSIPFLLVSGCSWPTSSIPEALRGLFWLAPASHGIPAWLSVQAMGASVAEVWDEVRALLILAFGYGIVGYALQAWRDRS